MHSGNYHLDHAGSTVLFGGRKMRGRKKRVPSNYTIMTIENMHSGNYHLDHAGSTVLFGGRKMRGRKKRAPSNYAIVTIEKL